MDAIRDRASDALAEAYLRHGGRMAALVDRLCGTPRTEEVLQEVFIRLWSHPEDYDPERGSLRTYLLVQVHRRAVDLLRRDRHGASCDLDVRDGLRPDGNSERSIRGADRRHAFEMLPDDERLPIVLAYYGGFTYREVAELLDEAEGAVTSSIRRGLRRLHLLLADRPDGPPP